MTKEKLDELLEAKNAAYTTYAAALEKSYLSQNPKP